MYVAVIPNRGSPPAILLRESYREAGKTKNRPSPTCPAGPPSASSNCAPCYAVTNCCPPPRRWKSSERCRTATCWPRSARRAASARHGAAAAGAATPEGSGAGPDRRALARARGQAGDGADAGPGHRQPFAGRGSGARQGHRQGGLCRARLARPRAALHRRHAGPPPSEEWCAAALRRHLHLSRRTLLRTGAMATAATAAVTGRRLSSA